MEFAKSKPGLRNLYSSREAAVQEFFNDIPALLEADCSLNVILAYAFFRLEQGQHQTLYCGARKLHRTESSLTSKALDGQHMTRAHFLELFETIYGFALDANAQKCIKSAEVLRDRLMHGKGLSAAEQREAISRALHYAEMVNRQIGDSKNLGFRPYCGDLRGFTGAQSSLDKATTRWILKGMGFSLA